MEGLVLGDIDVRKLAKVTAKDLYKVYPSTFPPPKVIFKFDVEWTLVWERLNSAVLDPLAREQLFMVIHNIVPNRERLFMKMNMVNSPNCLLCHEREDNVHLFMECILVREACGWVRLRLLSLLPEGCEQTSNFEFLNLMSIKNLMDNEAVWLLWEHL